MNLVENYESRYQTDEKTENKKTNKYNCSLDICFLSLLTRCGNFYIFLTVTLFVKSMFRVSKAVTLSISEVIRVIPS